MSPALPRVENPCPDSLIQMAEWSVERELWPKRRQDVLDRLAGHVADGAQVYLASSVCDPIVQLFSNRTGARRIATPLMVVDGRVLFAEPFAADDRKAEEELGRLVAGRVDIA
jgi:hypothetical protein